MKKWMIIGILAVLVIGMVLISGCTSSNSQSAAPSSSPSGDQAAVAKMSEMNNWMSPTIQVIGDSATSGDYTKMGLNSALLKRYIDQNLPEMRQLAASATTKKAAAQEYVAFLEDLRTSSDLGVQATDKYNSGDISGSTNAMNAGSKYLDQASTHMKQAMALLK